MALNSGLLEQRFGLADEPRAVAAAPASAQTATLAPRAVRRRRRTAVAGCVAAGLHLALGMAIALRPTDPPKMTVGPETAILVSLAPPFPTRARTTAQPPPAHQAAAPLKPRPAAPPPPAVQTLPLPAEVRSIPAAGPDKAPADPGAGAGSEALQADAANAPKAAPAPTRSSPGVQADFYGQVLARLQNSRHYPVAARRDRQEGVTRIRFTIDREGRILAADILSSSHRPLLDAEALATLQRAQPLPRIPYELAAPLTLTAPIEFSLRAGAAGL